MVNDLDRARLSDIRDESMFLSYGYYLELDSGRCWFFCVVVRYGG
jgi:hypothetical protein